MKIGLIANNINGLGGIERVVSVLSQKVFCQEDVIVFSFFSATNDETGPFLSPKVKVVHLLDYVPQKFYKNQWLKKTLLKFILLKEIKKYLQAEKLDFLITTSPWANCFLHFIFPDAKVILCEHGCYEFTPVFYRILRFFTYPLADAVVLLSSFEEKKYSFVSKKKRYVIPNPLPFEAKNQSACTEKRILYFGRFSEEKNIFALLKIAKILKEKLPDWRFDIFGEGPLEKELKDFANSSKLDGFVFFHKPTKNVQKELMNSSIHVLTSRTECLPMCILEAHACGVPSVAFDCETGPRAIIIHNHSGLLIPMGDINAFAEGIKMLTDNAELLRTFGENSKKRSRCFSVEKIRELWMQLFSELLNEQ